MGIWAIGPVDAALTLTHENDISSGDVAEIIVHCGVCGRNFCEPLEQKRHPANAISSQFSIPWAVASAIIYRRLPGIVVIILSHSVTVLSDLLKNLTLVFAAFFSWMAARRAASSQKPNYDYGFGKLEDLSSLLVAALMIVSIAIVVYETLGRFREPVAPRTLGLDWVSCLRVCQQRSMRTQRLGP